MTSIRLWSHLGVAAALTAGSLSAAAQGTHTVPGLAPQQGLLQLVDAAGEGEGAETATDDAGFAAQLAYVLGHMRVGTALYALGEPDMAKTHMKHPRDEIYEDLEPVLKARKAPGFAVELDAVTKAVEAGAPAAEVDAAFKTLEAAVAANMPSTEAGLVANTVQQIVRTAGEEFETAVKDGKIANVHEYQDAWGFVETAKSMLAALPAAEREEHKTEISAIEAELAGLSSLWPDITGKAAPGGTAKQLFASAAKIELQALAIE